MNKAFKSSLFLILGGLIAIGAGLFFTVTGQQQVARDTESATATVVDYEESQEYDSTSETNRTVYHPVMSYSVDGKTIESRYSQYEYSWVYDIGETVEIKYDPDNPEEFIIASDSGKFQYGVIWEIPLGVVLLAFGIGRIVYLLVMAKKSNKTSP